MVEREEVLKLAKLSKLSLSEAEISDFTADMKDIIAFAHTIGKSTCEATDTSFENPAPLREDIIKPSFAAEDILKNAPASENGYFRLQKRSDNK